MPRQLDPSWQIEPLHYLGIGANLNSYRDRRARGVVINAETKRPVPGLVINITRHRMNGTSKSDSVIRTDSRGRFALTNVPLYGWIHMSLLCPDEKPEHYPLIEAMIQGTPGLDTTMSVPIDYRNCIDKPPVVPINPLSGAEAVIGPIEARFVFPKWQTDLYTWDVPVKGVGAGSADYVWQVTWDIPDSSDGHRPYQLWLIHDWKPGGPRKGSLRDLIAGLKLQPMINCVTCDGAVYADESIDHTNVFATIEDGKLVFVVRGPDAMRRIFPDIPATVHFSRLVFGPAFDEAFQEVVVNCRNSTESPESKRRCDVKPKPQQP
jgi:hypothetical protein